MGTKENAPQKGNELSTHQVNQRLENYKKFLLEVKDAISVEKMRLQLKSETVKNEVNQALARNNFAEGVKTGIHLQEEITKVDQVFHQNRNKLSSKVHKQAKEIYKTNGETATKNFNTNKNQGQLKENFDRQIPKEQTLAKGENFSLSKETKQDKFRFEKHPPSNKPSPLKSNFNQKRDIDRER